MVDMAVDTTDPDPSSTAIANDQAVKTTTNESGANDTKDIVGTSPILKTYSHSGRTLSTLHSRGFLNEGFGADLV